MLCIDSVRNTGRQKQYQSLLPKIHGTQASLRSVNLNHISLNQAMQTHPFIQNQVINHPGWVLLSLSLSLSLFPSRLPVWQDCGQVGVQVCPLIQNDRWPLSLLPGDSGWADLTGRASCTSGRQGTGQTRCPGAVTEARSALAMYREIICLWEKDSWSASHLSRVPLFVSR